jgi:hypothetical protein
METNEKKNKKPNNDEGRDIEDVLTKILDKGKNVLSIT